MVDHVLALPEDTKVMIMSPLVVERKGEQVDLFDELRAQGFVRLRVNGKVYEMDNLPKLDKNKKHTIEIVVDRLKVCRTSSSVWPNHLRQRCAMPTGARWRWRWIPARSICSRPNSPARFATIRCRNSSRVYFRSTARWALAPSATAWATSVSSIRKRIVAFPKLSLSGGAIKGWDRRNQFYYQMLDSLAKHYDFDLSDRSKACRRKSKRWCCTAAAAKRFLSNT